MEMFHDKLGGLFIPGSNMNVPIILRGVPAAAQTYCTFGVVMIITTNTPMPVVTEAISKQGTKDASLGTRFVRKNGRNMKRGSLRRSQSLQVGTSKTQKLDAVAVAKESARIEEGRPETSYKPTKLGWREDGRPSNGRPMIVETAADAAELR